MSLRATENDDNTSPTLPRFQYFRQDPEKPLTAE